MWDWSKIPEKEHAAVIELFEARRWGEVAKLCEQYGVSLYCCCNQEGLQNWLREAIKTGVIKNDAPKATKLAENDG